MNIKVLLLLPIIFLIASCSIMIDRNNCDKNATRIEEKENSFQEKVGSYYDSSIVNVALNIFEEEWSNEWGNNEDVNNAVNNLCIVWEPYLFELSNGGETKEGLPKLYSGVTEDIGRVRVFISEQREIDRTALIHELVHVMLWRVNDEPDPDHESDKYRGWTDKHNDFIRSVNAKIKKVIE